MLVAASYQELCLLELAVLLVVSCSFFFSYLEMREVIIFLALPNLILFEKKKRKLFIMLIVTILQLRQLHNSKLLASRLDHIFSSLHRAYRKQILAEDRASHCHRTC